MKRIDMVYNLLLTKKESNAVISHTTETFSNLTKSDYDVHLFIPISNVKFIRNRRIHRIEINEKLLDTIYLLYYLWYNLILIFKYYRFIRKNGKPDLIYSRGLLPFPAIFSSFFKIPYYYEINGIREEELIIEGHSKLFYYIAKFSLRSQFKRSKMIIAVTKGIKAHIISEYGIEKTKIVMIENGVNTNKFKPIPRKPNKEFTLGFVGYFVKWQGLDKTINALKIVKKKGYKFRFHIIGGGSLKKDLKRLVQKNGLKNEIYFFGLKDYSEIPQIINTFDYGIVYKTPIKSGYSPLKLYEYLACGIPVIASDIESFQFINERKIGNLAHPNDENELAKVIIKAIRSNQNEISNMKRRARIYAIEHSWYTVSRKLIKIFNGS